MRRISLALTLLGAVAAAGCGGGKSASDDGSGGARGVGTNTFVVTIQNGQAINGAAANPTLAIRGGVVTSPAVPLIGNPLNCGVDAAGPHGDCQATFTLGTAVTLTATPYGMDPAFATTVPSTVTYKFLGWAGDCGGESRTCAMSGNADKYVLPMFGGARTGHENYTDPELHGSAYNNQATNGLTCTQCHGNNLQGVGIAVSCVMCHTFPLATTPPATPLPTASGPHFDATQVPWTDHGTGWSQDCQRCHTDQGFRDWVGADGTPNYLSGTFRSTGTLTTPPGGAGYANGPLQCQTCHNAASDPTSTTGGLTRIKFPSLLQVTTDRSTAVCGQCHGARESTSSITAIIAADRNFGGLPYFTATANVPGLPAELVTTTARYTAGALVGYTGIFAGNVSTALNGKQVRVTANTGTAITFTPANATTTLAGESAAFYPTATGGSTTTLVDSARTWTANQWKDYVVYFQTGNNAGLYRAVLSNDATTLTLSGGLPAAVAAGDFYMISAKEDSASADALFATSVAFVNPHYMGAAAIMFGAEAAGAYQYSIDASGASTTYFVYTRRNQHGIVAGRCTSCHDAHTLALPANGAELTAACGRCHLDAAGSPITTLAALEEERQFGFEGDVDGNGVSEPLVTEIDGLVATLYTTIQSYARNVVGKPICYTDAYPYIVYDTNGNGVCDTAEANRNNTFKHMTPRLLRATFNLKFFKAEPNAWAHNPRYAVEVLFDAITDLNRGLVARGFSAIPFAGRRTFEGHFGSASAELPAGGEQFRDWNGGTASASCSMCHAGEAPFAAYVASAAAPTSRPRSAVRPVTGMECTTCHQPQAADARFTRMRATAAGVAFPFNKSWAATFDPNAATTIFRNGDALCMTCHSGREAGNSVDLAIAAAPLASETNWIIGRVNPHYFGAAAIVLGSRVEAMYQYGTNVYVENAPHWGSPHGSSHNSSCVGCHSPQGSRHSFLPNRTNPSGVDGEIPATSGCGSCHYNESTPATPWADYRLGNYYLRIADLRDTLAATLLAYNETNAPLNQQMCLDTEAGDWYLDLDNDGVCSAAEIAGTRASFSPMAARAAFNLRWVFVEPGAWAHNTTYVEQALIDSILDLGGTLPAGVTRP